jgi:hypothetical protein
MGAVAVMAAVTAMAAMTIDAGMRACGVWGLETMAERDVWQMGAY